MADPETTPPPVEALAPERVLASLGASGGVTAEEGTEQVQTRMIANMGRMMNRGGG